MGLVLDMSPRSLGGSDLFCFLCGSGSGRTPLEKKQLLSEKEYRSYREKYGDTFVAHDGCRSDQASACGN